MRVKCYATNKMVAILFRTHYRISGITLYKVKSSESQTIFENLEARTSNVLNRIVNIG